MQAEMELHVGDCLNVMKGIPTGTVDLVYLDPPFFTQRVHVLGNRTRDLEFSFNDLWRSHSDYADFIHTRLKDIHRILHKTGSIFFHCDRNATHIVRFLLEDVFGEDMFQSEIIWHYLRWSNSKRGLLPSHQTIYWFSKTRQFKHNPQFTEYSPSTNVDQILQKRCRDQHNKAIYATDLNGDVILSAEKKGVPLSDVWDIPFLNPKARERVGYPTQKPILLLDRIIQLATEPGDLVLDPFCGSGTTLVSAYLNKRCAIGIDISNDAIALSRQRLDAPIRTDSALLNKGRGSYIQVDQKAVAILHGLDIIPVHRNSGIDAFLKETFDGTPIPIRVQRQNESLLDAGRALYDASCDKGARIMMLVTVGEGLGLDVAYLLPAQVIVVNSTANAVKSALKKLTDCTSKTPDPAYTDTISSNVVNA
ncbi:MAG: site-specific DNA-methyltransferase [Armatimonadetes bacterium]|nr:site-specific DNA-methyltransferase [Armatimonadota bacterium]